MTSNAHEQTLWVTIDSAGSCRSELREDGRLIGGCSGGALIPDATLMVKGDSLTYKELTHRLTKYNRKQPDPIFTERGQLEIGQHLFTKIVGTMVDEQKRNILQSKVSVRIVTEDETISLLPWCLLYGRRTFLAADNWSVAISRPRDECDNYTLPAHPKILVIAPEPSDRALTDAKNHLAEMKRHLSKAGDAHKLKENLRLVKSWEDFSHQLEVFEPDIVYYYGHGRVEDGSTRLVFEEKSRVRAQMKGNEVPVANFARVLKRHAPLLVYVNCCHGDAGGLLGVGKQLGEFVPAVITNCTTAYVDAARKQAIEIWKAVVLERMPPHEAVSAIRINLDKDELKLSFKDLRWLTPVLHYGYHEWSCEPADSDDDLNLDLNWRHKLNRRDQFFGVVEKTESLMTKPGARSLAFLTFGQRRQGFLDFYRRVEVELPNRISGKWLTPVRPAWPLEFGGNYHQSFSERLCEAFDVSSLKDIPNKVAGDRDKARKFLLLQHGPVELPDEGDLPGKHLYRLQLYLQWLNQKFIRNLPNTVFTLIGFSFAMSVPETFRVKADEMLVRGLNLELIRFSLLREFTSITTDELESFLEDNGLSPLSRDRIVGVINSIIEETGGIYEDVLEEVKNIDERAYNREAPARPSA